MQNRGFHCRGIHSRRGGKLPNNIYYGDNLPSVHNPPPRYNAGENESNLSFFRGQLGSVSASTPKTLNHEEWHHIMLYVLTNLDEVVPYMQ